MFLKTLGFDLRDINFMYPVPGTDRQECLVTTRLNKTIINKFGTTILGIMCTDAELANGVIEGTERSAHRLEIDPKIVNTIKGNYFFKNFSLKPCQVHMVHVHRIGLHVHRKINSLSKFSGNKTTFACRHILIILFF